MDNRFSDTKGAPLPPSDMQKLDNAARKLKAIGRDYKESELRLTCRIQGSGLRPYPSFSSPLEMDGIAFMSVRWHWGEAWLAASRAGATWRVVGLAMGAEF